MNYEFLFWIYLFNAVILIVHEIDSAYWQEWKLMTPKDDNGINGFLLLHIPMIFLILYGLVLISKGIYTGLIISFVLALSGIFAFFFHRYHMKKGRSEFNTPLSKSILYATLLISLLQIVPTIKLFFN